MRLDHRREASVFLPAHMEISGVATQNLKEECVLGSRGGGKGQRKAGESLMVINRNTNEKQKKRRR